MEAWPGLANEITMKKRRLPIPMRIVLSIPLFATELFFARVGLYHTAVLAELLPVLVIIGALIVALYSEKGMGGMLLFGCGIWIFLFPFFAPLIFRQATPVKTPQLYPVSHGKTRITLSNFSIATDWEVRSIGSRNSYGAPDDGLRLLSRDGKSEISLSVQSAKGSDPDADYRLEVKSGADFLRTGNEPQTAITFHSMPGLRMSHTSHGPDTFRLNDLPSDEEVTEDIIVVAWSDRADWHTMYVVTGYPTGNSAAKKEIDRVLATLEVNR